MVIEETSERIRCKYFRANERARGDDESKECLCHNTYAHVWWKCLLHHAAWCNCSYVMNRSRLLGWKDTECAVHRFDRWMRANEYKTRTLGVRLAIDRYRLIEKALRFFLVSPSCDSSRHSEEYYPFAIDNFLRTFYYSSWAWRSRCFLSFRDKHVGKDRCWHNMMTRVGLFVEKGNCCSLPGIMLEALIESLLPSPPYMLWANDIYQETKSSHPVDWMGSYFCVSMIGTEQPIDASFVTNPLSSSKLRFASNFSIHCVEDETSRGR